MDTNGKVAVSKTGSVPQAAGDKIGTGPSARLRAVVRSDSASVLFEVSFVAPSGLDESTCAPAYLTLGDGQHVDLGILCAPTRDTWGTSHTYALHEHVYATKSPHVATLSWGAHTLEARVDFNSVETGSIPATPMIKHFSAEPSTGFPLEVVVACDLGELQPDQSVRIDGGAGNIRWWTPAHVGDAGIETPVEWHFGYAKPGVYVIRVDLLDSQGFWLTTLTKTTVDITAPIADGPSDKAPAECGTLGGDKEGVTIDQHDVAHDSAATVPWLPFRYVRPMWSWARTYTQPGGSVVSRILGLGTYLAVRQEVRVGEQLWYQTGNFDWIPANSVDLIKPSELRGVELDVAGSGPSPEPEPDPDPDPEPEPDPGPDAGLALRGTVIANVLNVRAGPGVQYPIVDQIRYGTSVLIDSKAEVGGAVWYRIGIERWVHSGWIRLQEPEPEPEPQPTRQGIVTAYALVVRARPGSGADNPPVDRLLRGEQVTIFAEAEVDGALWYRIGEDRWVHSAWVRVVSSTLELSFLGCDSKAADVEPTSTELALPVGWVVTPTLHIRSAPNADPDSEIAGLLAHNQSVGILGETTQAGKKWYRIGADQWIEGDSVGVARLKARPSSIGANERWVGVNLREQTAVAYEGDKPIYAALVATGMSATPTVRGVFRTWVRYASRKMSGGSPATGGYYYLEEVTWTCYFYSGYALHAAYWHDAFGRPRSHGCVNMSPYDAWWIFQWSAAGGPNSPAVYVYWE